MKPKGCMFFSELRSVYCSWTTTKKHKSNIRSFIWGNGGTAIPRDFFFCIFFLIVCSLSWMKIRGSQRKRGTMRNENCQGVTSYGLNGYFEVSPHIPQSANSRNQLLFSKSIFRRWSSWATRAWARRASRSASATGASRSTRRWVVPTFSFMGGPTWNMFFFVNAGSKLLLIRRVPAYTEVSGVWQLVVGSLWFRLAGWSGYV